MGASYKLELEEENKIEEKEESGQKDKPKIEDFEILKMIGKGGFADILLVRNKNDQKLYAMKMINKSDEKYMIKKQKLERDIMVKINEINNPFLLKIKYAFQGQNYIYILTDYMEGGNLSSYLGRDKVLPKDAIRLYGAEIILALEDLHKNDIIYRDLKPQNVLVDSQGHIKICDFGISKFLKPFQRTDTFAGSPNYFAPEMNSQDDYDKNSDWWSLGVLLFYIRYGDVPFEYTRENVQKVVNKSLYIQSNGRFKDLIEGLLCVDPKNRLGSKNDAEDIKKHPFFKEINWEEVKKRKYKTPITPNFEPNILKIIKYEDNDNLKQKVLDDFKNKKESEENVLFYRGFTFN